jgi:hypothetical protein
MDEAGARYREMVRGAESSCCSAMVFRQVYPRERKVPTASSGPTSILLKTVTVTDWFYQCSSCEERCNAYKAEELRDPSAQDFSAALTYGTDEFLQRFVDWYRMQRFSAILPGTAVETYVHRYTCEKTGELRASIRTDQMRCPRRTHERNSLVLRFNLSRREFAACCWCSPAPIDSRPLEIVPKEQDKRPDTTLEGLDAEIRAVY